MYILSHFLYPFILEYALGYFHILAIENNAAVNIRMSTDISLRY